MAHDSWIVVKVGGSLFNWPDLRTRLRDFLMTLDGANVLLVPGGGATADAIRSFDQTHDLGAEAAHWLAIEALSVNARFLQQLVTEAHLLANFAHASGSETQRTHWYLLDALPFFRDDEARPDHLPHAWEVTSDSLAARAAILCEANELILLKSVAWVGEDWTEAAHAGIVDAYFPKALLALRVRVVNLRVLA